MVSSGLRPRRRGRPSADRLHTGGHTRRGGLRSSDRGTPTPRPTPVDELVVGVDGITYELAGETKEFPFADDGEELLALVEELTGGRDRVRRSRPVEGDWGMRYSWDEISIPVAGDTTSVSVSAPAIGGVPVVTPEGLSIGSSRDEVVAAGGRDGWDADQDGVADYMDLGEQEVPDTESLSRPGEIGILFVTVGLLTIAWSRSRLRRTTSATSDPVVQRRRS